MFIVHVHVYQGSRVVRHEQVSRVAGASRALIDGASRAGFSCGATRTISLSAQEELTIATANADLVNQIIAFVECDVTADGQATHHDAPCIQDDLSNSRKGAVCKGKNTVKIALIQTSDIGCSMYSNRTGNSESYDDAQAYNIGSRHQLVSRMVILWDHRTLQNRD